MTVADAGPKQGNRLVRYGLGALAHLLAVAVYLGALARNLDGCNRSGSAVLAVGPAAIADVILVAGALLLTRRWAGRARRRDVLVIWLAGLVLLVVAVGYAFGLPEGCPV